MPRTLSVSEKATIYHYQLMRKIKLLPERMASYGCIALVLGLVVMLVYGDYGAWMWITGLVSMLAVHWLILRLTMLRVEEEEDRRWGWRYKLPWFGYLPMVYVEHQLFRRLHRHLLWLGLCAIALAYPWASEPLMISLVGWHLWLLAPRLILLRNVRKLRKDGLLKFNEQEAMFYHR